jgi:arsenate reductase
MAHGYLEHFARDKAQIYSAGIEIHGLNERAVAIMDKDGLDISNHTSNHVDEYIKVNFDFIITVCDHANENCPYIPSKKAIRVHQNFKDPSKVDGSEEEIQQAFKTIRNEIKTWCKKFVNDNL